MEEILNNEAEDTDIEEILLKKGILSKIKDFYEEITDENSDLYQKTIQLRNGAKKIQKLLKGYNEFAKLIPCLPQIPDVLLGS